MILTDEMYHRAYLSPGSRVRLDRFLERANRGEHLVVGAIGGSITEGAAATMLERRYLHRIAARLADHCPSATFEVVNAGIGASNSLFGAFRIGRDLLEKKPDIILIDYAVNDATSPSIAPPFEALVRAALGAAGSPPVILLFMLNDSGGNCQEIQAAVGRHYQLPMVSVRDAVWPEIERGVLTWGDYSPDTVHPNDAGHDLVAEMAVRALMRSKSGDASFPLPERLHPASAIFEGGAIVDATGMALATNRGWQPGPHTAGYTGLQSSTPGSEFVATVNGRYIAIGYKQFRGDFGIAEATVDDRPPVRLDGFFNPERATTWAGGHTVLVELATDLPRGDHTVRVRLTDQRHALSNGHQFDVGYFLVS
jgi:lysophospholipase L1-like esterase